MLMLLGASDLICQVVFQGDLHVLCRCTNPQACFCAASMLHCSQVPWFPCTILCVTGAQIVFTMLIDITCSLCKQTFCVPCHVKQTAISELIIWVRCLTISVIWSNILFKLTERKEKEEKNYAGGENHSPHQSRKRSHFATEYRIAPPPRKGKENQWGSRGLQAWPETGSWWELITVLERARLVWTSLAANFTECTWRLEVSFLTL